MFCFLTIISALFSVCLTISSCVIGENVEVSQAYSPEGMGKIHAKESAISLGSTAPGSGPDERPVMPCRFTYDFWMDTAEVTVSQYFSITGKLPEPYGSVKEQNADSPVCFVSWYDAVLFCNARSRMDGLDTIYTYRSIDSTTDGRVFNINGLQVNYNKGGYRLPTEAEWEFAARAGASGHYAWGNKADEKAAAEIAWYAGNSEVRPHSVAQLKPNPWGLYDMFGNAMEWVNDVKENYLDQTVADFVGGISVQSKSRSVKGGSFAHGLNKLRFASRSDVYATVASTANRYIGFRCALGTLDQVYYSGSETVSAVANPVYLVRKEFEDLVSGARKKLAFINKTKRQRYLCYVDFSELNPRVYQFTDMPECYMPTISPDGKWVTFCTGGEGLTGVNSSVYARRLDRYGSGLVKLSHEPAFVPRWTFHDDSKETFLLYATSTTLNTSKAWELEKTYQIAFEDGVFKGEPVVVESKGAYHGGLSRDGRYIATGYDRLIMKDRVSGTARALFTGPKNGKAPGDTSQVCNVSISQNRDNPDQALFIDFGYPDTSGITGFAYGIHEVLYVGNFSGEVFSWVMHPPQYQAWDHPEWAWDAPVAAANVRNEKGEHSAIFIVDPISKDYLKIIEGQDLWHPFLWTGPEIPGGVFQVNYDSLMQYNTPASTSYQMELADKMPMFWLQRDSLEIVFLGSSGVRNSVEPRLITSHRSLNLAIGGGDLPMSVDLIEHYVIPHCPKVKLVGISLDIGWLNLPDASFSWYDGFFNTAGYNYDKSHDFWRSGAPAEMKEIAGVLCPKCATSTGYPPLNTAINGWGESSPLLVGDYKWPLNNPEVLKNLEVFKKTAEELASRQIHLLVLNPPLSPRYKSQDYYGPWGPSQQTAQSIIDTLKSLEAENPYFHLYDANLFGEHDYSEVEAYDFNHLNRKGAEKLTLRLTGFFKDVLK